MVLLTRFDRFQRYHERSLWCVFWLEHVVVLNWVKVSHVGSDDVGSDIKENMSTKWLITFLFLVTCDLSAMLIGNVVIEIERVSINAPA